MLTETDWQEVVDCIKGLVDVDRAMIWRNSGPGHHRRLFARSRRPSSVPPSQRGVTWSPVWQVVEEVQQGNPKRSSGRLARGLGRSSCTNQIARSRIR